MKKLERKLTLPAVIAISIGGMLGTGIFVLPGVAAGMIGEYLWLAYIFSGLFIFASSYSQVIVMDIVQVKDGMNAQYEAVEKFAEPIKREAVKKFFIIVSQ